MRRFLAWMSGLAVAVILSAAGPPPEGQTVTIEGGSGQYSTVQTVGCAGPTFRYRITEPYVTGSYTTTGQKGWTATAGATLAPGIITDKDFVSGPSKEWDGSGEAAKKGQGIGGILAHGGWHYKDYGGLELGAQAGVGPLFDGAEIPYILPSASAWLGHRRYLYAYISLLERPITGNTNLWGEGGLGAEWGPARWQFGTAINAAMGRLDVPVSDTTRVGLDAAYGWPDDLPSEWRGGLKVIVALGPTPEQTAPTR